MYQHLYASKSSRTENSMYQAIFSNWRNIIIIYLCQVIIYAFINIVSWIFTNDSKLRLRGEPLVLANKAQSEAIIILNCLLLSISCFILNLTDNFVETLNATPALQRFISSKAVQRKHIRLFSYMDQTTTLVIYFLHINR